MFIPSVSRYIRTQQALWTCLNVMRAHVLADKVNFRGFLLLYLPKWHNALLPFKLDFIIQREIALLGSIKCFVR